MRRVVVTGLGIVSPLGIGLQHNWDQLTAGRSGIRKIEHFDVSDISSQIAGVVPTSEESNPSNGAFHINDFVEPKEQKKIDVFIAYIHIKKFTCFNNCCSITCFYISKDTIHIKY